ESAAAPEVEVDDARQSPLKQMLGLGQTLRDAEPSATMPEYSVPDARDHAAHKRRPKTRVAENPPLDLTPGPRTPPVPRSAQGPRSGSTPRATPTAAPRATPTAAPRATPPAAPRATPAAAPRAVPTPASHATP